MQSSLENIGNNRSIWEIITNTYPQPTATTQPAVPATGMTAAIPVTTVQPEAETVTRWQMANIIALLTIRKNMKEHLRIRIANLRTASIAFNTIREMFEEKTKTEYYCILNNVIQLPFDDRTTTIENFIEDFDKR